MTTSKVGIDAKAAIKHLRTADPMLGKFIDEIGPFEMQLDATSSLFMSLAEAIVYQQLHGRAAATIFGRVRALFTDPEADLVPEEILAATDEQLRGAGLSRAKAASLRDLALKVVDGELPTLEEAHAMDDEELVVRLVAVRGIGRWTAEMFLMFALGRPDILPVDDFGVRKGFATLYGLTEPPTKIELRDYGERWTPYRTVASWYLWRAAETKLPGSA